MNNKLILRVITVFSLFGVAEAANIVPLTSLTKHCESLVNTALPISKSTLTGLSERAHRRLTKAQERMAEDKFDEAADLLKQIIDHFNEPIAQYSAAKYLAVIYQRQEKTEKATEYFSKALVFGDGVVDHRAFQDLIKNVASLHYANDNMTLSIELLERWMANSNVNDDQVFLLYSAALMNLEKIEQSVCPAFWSAVVADKPKESALSQLLNSHFQLEDYIGAIEILKRLVLEFPKQKKHWRNLSAVYAQQEMYDESLVVMEMFYVRGQMDKDADFQLLASMFSYNGIPYRAATILREGVTKEIVDSTESSWNEIASNFRASGEIRKAIDAYAKSAAIANHGENDLIRAELLSDVDQYESAVKSFDVALKKGDLKDTGKAYFRKGIALYQLSQYGPAITTLKEAQKYTRWKDRAIQWSRFIEKKQQRLASN
jgi:tetratricopeptide (TPR) repeat protein